GWSSRSVVSRSLSAWQRTHAWRPATASTGRPEARAGASAASIASSPRIEAAETESTIAIDHHAAKRESSFIIPSDRSKERLVRRRTRIRKFVHATIVDEANVACPLRHGDGGEYLSDEHEAES